MARLGLDGAASLLVDAAGRLPGVAAAMSPTTQAVPLPASAIEQKAFSTHCPTSPIAIAQTAFSIDSARRNVAHHTGSAPHLPGLQRIRSSQSITAAAISPTTQALPPPVPYL